MIPAGIISADGHVCEPANCYVDHIDPKYREQAPYITTLDDGTDAFVVPGMRKPVALGFVDGAGFTPTERKAARQDDEVLRRAPGRLPRQGAHPVHGPRRHRRRADLRVRRDGHLHAPRRRVQGGVHEGLQPLAGRDVRRRAGARLRHGPDGGARRGLGDRRLPRGQGHGDGRDDDVRRPGPRGLRPPRLRRPVGVRHRPAAADRLPHPHVTGRQPSRCRPAATR